MNDLIDLNALQETIETILVWARAEVLVPTTLAQAILVGVCFLVARFFDPRLAKVLGTLPAKATAPWLKRAAYQAERITRPLILPLIWLFLQGVLLAAATTLEAPRHLIASVSGLLTAWVVIRLASTLVASAFWSRLIAVFAWSLAALNIIDLLDPVLLILDSMALQLGEMRISVLGVAKAVIALAILIWAALGLANTFERRLLQSSSLTPSMRVLSGKLVRISLFTAAILIALNSVGIDLTALAVFSGAVGLGIGFGLQKVVSNLLSGVILLLEKSVKPGDVIAIGETYGWINALSARYVSVITRDGTEHLIPNEELISQRVENWSHSHQLVRQRIPFGISYENDPHEAIALSLDAAAACERVLTDPAPRCLVKGFGDNSVDLELRIWINDPQNGLSNVKSEIMLRLWDIFKENGIEFPYPQRDIHLPEPVTVRIERD